MPTDRAAFSYQPNDRKSVRLAGAERFSLVTLLVRELTDLRSTLRDTFWFKILSLGEGANSGHGRVYL
jgi:ribbon-helix-helix protein